MSFQQPRAYNLSLALSDIPQCMAPSKSVKPIPSESRVVAIASSSAAQDGGGMLSFMIPSQGGYARSGSFYLKCRITESGATAGSKWSFAGPTRSASAIINRFTMMAGSQVVEQINHYNILHDTLLLHASSAGYANDSRLYQYSTSEIDVDAEGAAVNVCIPLISGLLNSGYDLPLFMFSGNVTVNIDLNSTVQALVGAAITKYTVSEAQLVYEEVRPEGALIAKMRQELSGDKKWSIPFVSFRNLAAANTGVFSQILGLNVSSLRSVLFTKQEAKTQAAVGNFNWDTLTDAKLYLDGRIVNAVTYNSSATHFAELNRCLNRLNDTDRSSLTSSLENYKTKDFVSGINCTRVAEAGMAFTGTPVNQAVIELRCAGVATQTVYVMACYDTALTIDGLGICEVLQ